MKVTPGETYQHHKGVFYRVLHLATDANNRRPRMEPRVVYEAIDGIGDSSVYVRTLHEFRQSFKPLPSRTNPDSNSPSGENA